MPRLQLCDSGFSQNPCISGRLRNLGDVRIKCLRQLGHLAVSCLEPICGLQRLFEHTGSFGTANGNLTTYLCGFVDPVIFTQCDFFHFHGFGTLFCRL